MSANQLVCIKRPEPSLSAVFEDMYLNERLVDVTLSCCDGELQAHRLVLAACSSYFSSVFDKLANPFQYPVIIIKDMGIEDLRLIVDFMYRGQLTISQERLMTLVKSAESLQINGLSSVEGIVTSDVDSRDGAHSNIGARALHQRAKRGKKSLSSSSQHHNQALFGRTYQSRQDELDSRSSPQPEKMLEQSMITGESIDDSHPSQQFYNDPATTKSFMHQIHNSSPPSLQSQHVAHIEQPHQQQHQQQLNNQLQVLSHSLTVNRSSLRHSSINSQQSIQVSPQSRIGVHPCNICWKTFREKANLKRHLQVHSLDRVVYACPDCNKTFSWKDNFIRHTKTAHHMNNIRPPA